MAGEGKKDGLSAAEREARDRRIVAGLIAQEPWALEEARPIIRMGLGQMAKRWARWLIVQGLWQEWCQRVLTLLVEWQKAGDMLRPDESLWALTWRLAQQTADKLHREERRGLRWSKLAFSLQENAARSKKHAELEAAVAGAAHAFNRYPNPEHLAAVREQLGWVLWAEQRLSDDDHKVVDAVIAVDDGEHETVGKALGIEDAAGRKRKRRLLERLAHVAITEGNRAMARRLAGTKYADALELLFVAAPGADHRIEELGLLRDGELSTEKKIELERHVAECDGCRRCLRLLNTADESLAALVLLPKLAFDSPDLGTGTHGPLPSSPVPRWVGVAAVAGLAALVYSRWPVAPLAATAPDAGTASADAGHVVPARAGWKHLYGAPIPPHEVDGGSGRDGGANGDAGRP